MYSHILDTFMPSEEMREYLKSVNLSSWELADLIFYSPTSIFVKQQVFQKIISLENRDAERKKEFENYLWNLDESIRLLDFDGIFLVNIMYFNEKKGTVENESEFLCDSIQDIMASEREGQAIWFKDEGIPYWIESEKWMKDKNKKYVRVCEYIIANGTILYSELDDEKYDFSEVIHWWNGVNLNLPVPFKTGTLLEIDGFPFTSPYYTLLISVGDNRDCCCLQGLSRNEKICGI